jgi:hypothetical protein
MDLRLIVAYLSMKDMNAREIDADMNGTLGQVVFAPNCCEVSQGESFSKSMLDTDFEPKIEEENFIDEAILRALQEYPFSSLRQIAEGILIPMNMV